MPKVKQTKMKLSLNPSRPWEETIVYVNYDNRPHGSGYYSSPPKERFYIKLPQVVADALGMEEVRGDVQEEAEKLFKETIEKFKNLKTEINRVILYDIEVEPHPQAQKSFYSSPTGYKVKIWAGTYEETVAIAGDGNKRYSYEKKESQISFPGQDYAVSSRTRREGAKYDHQIPWNDANEAFFLWVSERMVNLIAHLAALENPENLLKTVNEGRLLPLGSSEK